MTRLFLIALAIVMVRPNVLSQQRSPAARDMEAYTTVAAGVNAQSDWCWQNPLPCGNNLNDVCSFGSNTWIAVGDVGTIIRSTDGGINWTLQSSGTTLPLKSVCFADAKNGWTVGGGTDDKGVPSSVILHTTDSGLTWVIQTSGTVIPLNGVSFKDPHTGTAVGGYYDGNDNDGIILGTTDGGETWVTQFIDVGPSYYYFTAVSRLGSSTAVVVGVNGRIFRTTNGGADWSSLETSFAELNDVSFVDTNVGVIVGGGGMGVILRTTDGGKQWTSQMVGGPVELRGVCFADTSIGFAVGTQYGTGLILKTTNGGRTWTFQSPVTSEWANYAAIWFDDENTATLVGDLGTILRTTDAGNSWVSQVRGFTNNLSDVCFVDADTGWVVGDGTILRTGDGGETWSIQLMDSSLSLGDVFFVDMQTGVAVGTDWNTGLGRIFKTADGGNTWTPKMNMVAGPLHGVWFVNEDTGVVVGEDQNVGVGIILRTTNGGDTWAKQSIDSTSTLNDVCFADVNNGSILAVKAGTYEHIIFRTTDGGSSWMSLSVNPNTTLRGISFSDAHQGTIVGGGVCMGPGIMLRTTDGGLNWATQYLFSGQGGLSGIHFFSQGETTVGIAVGTDEKGNGLVLTSTDGGNNWERQSTVTHQWLEGGCFADSRNGWAVGGNGTILHTTNGGVTFVKEEQVHEVPTRCCLLQNYPNPFNPMTTIRYQLPVISDVRLAVYDILGREIEVLVNERMSAGAHEVKFDAADLSSGVYFTRLVVGDFVQVRKLVLLK